jgi:CPA1 family monovalent cation:H+ antiporter
MLVGFGISYLTQRIELPLAERCLTIVSAYGSYILAEHLGGSGVIAVAVDAMILGNYGSRIGMSSLTRLIVTDFWEFIAFLVNSLIFLLIGTQIRFPSLLSHFDLIVLATLVARLASVLVLGAIGNVLSHEKLSLAEQTALWWGGLKGAVPIALVLVVPDALPGRQELIDVVFGVVLFSLLVQGLSMEWLMQKLNLVGDQPLRQEYAQLSARRIALERVLGSIARMDEQFPNLDPEYRSNQINLLEKELKSIEESIQKLISDHPQLQSVDKEQYRRTLLDIEADTYAELSQSGWLNKNLAPILTEVELKLKEGELVSLNQGIIAD